MNNQKIIDVLKKGNILENIEDGPTAITLSDGRKDYLLTIKRVDDYVEISTGKIFKHKTSIPISKIK